MGELAVGVMSGTSGDGVSVVLARFKRDRFEILGYKTFSYPAPLASRLESVLNGKASGAAEISALDFELGGFFAEAVLKLLRSRRVPSGKVAVIGSHGQTIFHAPRARVPSTFQIGEPALIAERTGIPVVSDFRPQDIAAGGCGAPLLPFFDHFFFGGGNVRALQNIGGIANVAVVGKSVARPLAFDSGPGNRLIDWAVREATGGRKKYDAGGDWARQGKIDFEMVKKMAAHPYFRRPPPKSAGRELFNADFLPAELKRNLRKNPEDVVATLTHLTAFTIARGLRQFVLGKYAVKEVIVSGGGAFNRTLMEQIAGLLAPLPVVSIEAFALHPQAKEPLAFAFYALRALRGKSNHLPAGTGARGERFLGKITPGKTFKGAR